VLQPRGSLLRRSVEAILRRYDIPPPENVVNTPSILMSMVLTARTDAIAPLGAPVADLFCATGYFVRLPLTERIMIEPYGLIKLRDRVLSPTAQLLYEAVRKKLFAP
jgi:DNA-binding transcriptional LysR family regulator